MSGTSISNLLNFRLPNMKSVIMAVLRPELKAISDIYEEEIKYMRDNIDRQNLLLLKIQGYFATQSSQIVDRIMKDLELSLAIHQLKIHKVDRTEHNSLVDNVVLRNGVLDQVQTMLLDINNLKNNTIDIDSYNSLVSNVSTLGDTLQIYVDMVNNLKLLVDDVGEIDVTSILASIDTIQSQVNTLFTLDATQTIRIEEVYNTLFAELESIKATLTNP